MQTSRCAFKPDGQQLLCLHIGAASCNMQTRDLCIDSFCRSSKREDEGVGGRKGEALRCVAQRIGFSECGRDRPQFGWPAIRSKLRTNHVM